MNTLQKIPFLTACQHFELEKLLFDDEVAFVTQFMEHTSIPAPTKEILQKVVQEVLQEIYIHAFRQKKGKATLICSFYPESSITLKFIDHGLPFNPTNHRKSLLLDEDSAVRGEGFDSCLKTLEIDEISYSRENEANTLTLTKKL